MADLLAHRGPDGWAAFTDSGVTLAHRRLAVVDVATGQQPMQDASGRFTIVYNGEAYNHVRLRGDLEASGVRFRTHSDTEVVLEGWARWGPGVLGRLEGMFALALWDAQQRRLVLARDRWGVKPLHYTEVGGDVLFASEAKAFAAHPAFAFRADEDAFREWAVLEFLTGSRTFFRGVNQVPPGCLVRFGEGAAPVVQALEGARQALGEANGRSASADPRDGAAGQRRGTGRARPVEHVVRALKEGLVASVRQQSMAEVPVATVLSGGVDSALVAHLHQQAADGPIQTFTVADSAAVPDYQEAAALAEWLGTDHHASTFTADDVWRSLPRHAWHNEATNYTESFFFHLFAAMRGKATVALCGQGSDELWGGYARYRDPARLAAERLARLDRVRPAHAATLRHAIQGSHRDGATLAAWDQGGQLANFQLRLADRNGMAHGIEARVPFLGTLLQGLSDRVPWDWKVRDGVEKWVLRKAAEELGLPARFAWRRKVPAGRATAPQAIAAVEARLAGQVDARRWQAHPLAACFATPAPYVVHRIWEEVFLHGQDPRRIQVEDVT